MTYEFEISLAQALTVVTTTVCIYLVFIALVRVVGPRSLTSTSSFDFACVVAFGAILGRTVLLARPTLVTGVIALTTFVGMQGLLGFMRTVPGVDRWLNRPPVLLVADGKLLAENMRKSHVVEDEIRQAVRRAGASGPHDVRCVVLERNGAMSVVRSTDPVDPWLLADVRAAASD